MLEPIFYIHFISLGFRTDRIKANILSKTLNSVQKGSKYKNVKPIYKVICLFIQILIVHYTLSTDYSKYRQFKNEQTRVHILLETDHVKKHFSITIMRARKGDEQCSGNIKKCLIMSKEPRRKLLGEHSKVRLEREQKTGRKKEIPKMEEKDNNI